MSERKRMADATVLSKVTAQRDALLVQLKDALDTIDACGSIDMEAARAIVAEVERK